MTKMQEKEGKPHSALLLTEFIPLIKAVDLICPHT